MHVRRPYIYTRRVQRSPSYSTFTTKHAASCQCRLRFKAPRRLRSVRTDVYKSVRRPVGSPTAAPTGYGMPMMPSRHTAMTAPLRLGPTCCSLYKMGVWFIRVFVSQVRIVSSYTALWACRYTRIVYDVCVCVVFFYSHSGNVVNTCRLVTF